MDSVKIWDARWTLFKRSFSSTGSQMPESISEIYHQYESYLLTENMMLDSSMKVLDIGAGSGRWVYKFAPIVNRVVAIEPTNAFYLLKKNMACFSNVECQKKAFRDFESDEKFDLVIISGVLMYLSDDLECDEFLRKAFEITTPGGVLMIRDKLSRNKKIEMMGNQRIEKDTVVEYVEVSRTLDYYLNKCRKYGFEMFKTMPNHATVFYKCNFPFAKKQIQKIILKTFNRRHLAVWCVYNVCFRRIEAFVRKVFGAPKMYIMILRDTKKRAARIENRCTKHLMRHVGG